MVAGDEGRGRVVLLKIKQVRNQCVGIRPDIHVVTDEHDPAAIKKPVFRQVVEQGLGSVKIAVGVPDDDGLAADFVGKHDSVTQLLGTGGQVFLAFLRVAGGRVQRFVAEDLGQADQIVAGFFEVSVSHRVSVQVREQLESTDRRIPVAQIPHASFAQRATLADENPCGFHWRSAFQVGLQRSTGWQRQRHRTLFVALALIEYRRPASLTQHQVSQFEGRQIANPTASEEEQIEDGIGPKVAAKLNLTKQSADLATVESLRCELLPPEFLDLFRRVRCGVTLIDQPCEEAADGHDCSIDGRGRLALHTPKVITEIGHVTASHSTNREPLFVCLNEPLGEFAQVVLECPSSVGGKIVVGKEPFDEGRFMIAKWGMSKITIARIFHHLSP